MTFAKRGASTYRLRSKYEKNDDWHYNEGRECANIDTNAFAHSVQWQNLV